MAGINPFQGPINYSVDVQSPFEAALAGMKMGAGIAEVQAAQQKRELERKALEQAQAAQVELKNLFQNKNATAADFARASAFLPKDQAESVRKSFEMLTTEKQQNSLKNAAQVYSALKSNQPNIAKDLLRQQANAEKNAGREQDAKATEKYLELIELDPTGAQTIIGLMTAGLPGGKELLENVDKTLSTGRAEALAPSELKKKIADAEAAVSDAKIKLEESKTAEEKQLAAVELAKAQARKAKLEADVAERTEDTTVIKLVAEADRAVADANKAVAEAEISQANAKNAEQRSEAELKLAQAKAEKEKADAEKAKVDAEVAKETKADIISGKKAEAIIKQAEAKFAPDKFGAELGLTRAQIDASKAARRASDAAAAKSGADAARARAEADQIAKGVIPADKRTEAEFKLRKEFTDQTKVFQDIKSSYGRVKVSEDTAVGDLSLIFGFMKMLDPGSVVREGEFATAQNAAGVPERVANLYNRVISGERLSKSQRDSFKGQAEKLYKSASEQEKVVRDGIGRIAGGYGLNTKNIFYTDKEVPPSGPEPKPADKVTVGGKTYARPATMTDAQWNAYKRSVGVQ
jgi:hypothetical protein